MALELDLAPDMTPIGIAIGNAYARITEGRFTRDSFSYRVAIYASRDARFAANAQPVREELFEIATPDLTGNLFATLYADLKARPRFAAATDA